MTFGRRLGGHAFRRSCYLLSVFICYRRDDASAWAGRLYDGLERHFGREHVFIDVDALSPGDDFAAIIDSKLQKCDVLLAIIGPQWLVIGTDGSRRINDPGDYVRLEIEGALHRQIRVVPVRVGGAALPSSEELPESITALAGRHALELRDNRWADDLRMLVDRLGEIERALRSSEAASGRRGLPRRLLGYASAGIALVAVLAIVFSGLWLTKPQQPVAAPPSTKPTGAAQPLDEVVTSVVRRLETGCNGIDARTACRELGVMYLLGRDLAQDYGRALTLFSKACEVGDMGGCFELGGLYSDGLGTTRDEKRGTALYERACLGGDAGGCLNQGYMLATGRATGRRDEVAATPLYEKACGNGEAIGCRNLGEFYRDGRGGLTRDRRRAETLFRQACDGGDDVGCLRLRALSSEAETP